MGTPLRIAWRHLLTNTTALLLVQISLDIGFAILAASSLSFIGMGVQSPMPDWSLMVSGPQSNERSAWRAGVYSGLSIALAVPGFNVPGDVNNDMLDPRHGRQAHKCC